MRIVSLVLLATLLLSLFVSCTRHTIKPPPGDKLIWSSEKARPVWVQEGHKLRGAYHIFVGMSNKYAEEKGARDDAERDCRLQAAQYFETAVRDVFERITAELGFQSTVLDPSVAARGYTEMISQAVIQKAGVSKFYEEKYRSAKTGEYYFLCFALMEVPEEQVRESFSSYVNRKREEWKLSQEQVKRVNEVFRQYWESKKEEDKGKE